MTEKKPTTTAAAKAKAKAATAKATEATVKAQDAVHAAVVSYAHGIPEGEPRNVYLRALGLDQDAIDGINAEIAEGEKH